MLDPRAASPPGTPAPSASRATRPSEIIGQHFSRFYPQEDIARGSPSASWRSRPREGRFEDEGWRRAQGRLALLGQRRHHRAARRPAATLVGFAKVTRDLTERRAAESTSGCGSPRREEAIRLRDEFLSHRVARAEDAADRAASAAPARGAAPASQPGARELATRRSPRARRSAERLTDLLSRPAGRVAHRHGPVRAAAERSTWPGGRGGRRALPRAGQPGGL